MLSILELLLSLLFQSLVLHHDDVTLLQITLCWRSQCGGTEQLDQVCIHRPILKRSARTARDHFFQLGIAFDIFEMSHRFAETINQRRGRGFCGVCHGTDQLFEDQSARRYPAPAHFAKLNPTATLNEPTAADITPRYGPPRKSVDLPAIPARWYKAPPLQVLSNRACPF